MGRLVGLPLCLIAAGLVTRGCWGRQGWGAGSLAVVTELIAQPIPGLAESPRAPCRCIMTRIAHAAVVVRKMPVMKTVDRRAPHGADLGLAEEGSA
jgi:hypothetical protein